jgi:hypothetical protein
MAIKFLSAIDHGAYQLPTADGSNGQVLTTDGNGNVTFQSVSSSSNYYLSGASFNTSDGVLTLTVSGASNQTVDLDGRYALSSHSHNYDNYGSWNLKTNGTQRTTVQSGGDLNLVAGSNVSLSYSAGGTVTITSTDTNTDTNDIDYINGASFNTGNGILSLTGVGNAGASVDLDGRYLTSYTETDTLASVTARGASTSTNTTFNGTLTANSGLQVPFATGQHKPMVVLTNATNYGLFHTEAEPADEFTFDFAGTQTYKFSQNGTFTLNGATLTSTKVGNWDTAYGWGDHAAAGYVTSSGNTIIGTDSDIITSGATVVDDIYMTDGVITSHSTRTLTLANLGYTGSATADDYGGWRISDGSVTEVIASGDTLIVTGAGATGVSYDAGTNTLEISSSDTNTNNYITGASFSTSNGVLTLTRQGLGDLTVDLDGRFTDNGYADALNQHLRTSDSPSFAGMTINGNLTVTGTTVTDQVEVVSTSNGILFEGSAADAYEGLLLASTLTADRTYTLPNASGTVALTSNIPTVNNATLTVQGTGALGGSGTFTANASSNVTISISHDDTSTLSGAYGGNNNGIVIEDITVDGYGHVTAIGTRDLDGRFATPTDVQEVNDRIDNEVLPLIPTDTGDLTNGAGYITNSVTDFYVADQILHTGDTNTYMQFHAVDQWRVVTGGAERLEVNNTATTVANTLTASGGINGLTLGNGGISGSNYNITGVNQLEIADPGEGIVFTSGASGNMTLAIVDDASDNILNFSGTGATLKVNGNLVYHAGNFTDNSTNWDTAYGWGNHASAGYLTSETYTAHEDTSTLSGAYGGNNNGIVIEDITVDSNGHVTAVGTRDLDGRFDSLGSAATAEANAIAHADDRIDNEVLPLIPTNNNQLTNGAGYITDGNTNWNNSYGFITATSTDTLSNKSGNISQWTNDSGYLTSETYTGTVTSVTVGTGLDVSNGTTTPNITLDLSEFTDMTAAVDTAVDELILLDNGAERRKRFAEIFGSAAYQDSSAFDAAGSADAVNDRIDNEVLPSIPTNNNQLTNGAGYITGYTVTSSDVTTALGYTPYQENTALSATTGTFSGDVTVNGNQVITTGTNADVKFSVWSGTTYGIGMTSGVTYGGLNDYAMTFCMNNDSDRGFWWGYSGQTKSSGAMSLTTAGVLTVASSITAGGDITAFSDVRVKENIEDLEGSLDKVTQLRGVSYNHIDAEERSIGVIAQEIQEVLPEVVREGQDGMLSVAYGNITAVLIEAIKEQQDIISQLEERIVDLENRM